jgi:hypothetical protein
MFKAGGGFGYLYVIDEGSGTPQRIVVLPSDDPGSVALSRMNAGRIT